MIEWTSTKERERERERKEEKNQCKILNKVKYWTRTVLVAILTLHIRFGFQTVEFYWVDTHTHTYIEFDYIKWHHFIMTNWKTCEWMDVSFLFSSSSSNELIGELDENIRHLSREHRLFCSDRTKICYLSWPMRKSKTKNNNNKTERERRKKEQGEKEKKASRKNRRRRRRILHHHQRVDFSFSHFFPSYFTSFDISYFPVTEAEFNMDSVPTPGSLNIPQIVRSEKKIRSNNHRQSMIVLFSY